MGLFSLFRGKPEEREAKRIRDLAKKSQEKYGEASGRVRALETLREIGSPQAIAALLQRFTVRTEPTITDGEEKEYTLSLIKELGDDAIEPLMDFIRANDNVAWAVRCLEAIVDEDELIDRLTGLIEKISMEYARDPEKKIILINRLAEASDPKVVAAILPLLQDPSDEVRIATLNNLVAQGDATAADPIAEGLLSAESPRVRAASAEALAALGAPISEEISGEALFDRLPEGFTFGKDRVVKKKG